MYEEAAIPLDYEWQASWPTTIKSMATGENLLSV